MYISHKERCPSHMTHNRFRDIFWGYFLNFFTTVAVLSHMVSRMSAFVENLVTTTLLSPILRAWPEPFFVWTLVLPEPWGPRTTCRQLRICHGLSLVIFRLAGPLSAMFWRLEFFLKVFLAQFTVLMRTDSETEGSEILVIQREPQAGECSCNKGAVGMN